MYDAAIVMRTHRRLPWAFSVNGGMKSQIKNRIKNYSLG